MQADGAVSAGLAALWAGLAVGCAMLAASRRRHRLGKPESAPLRNGLRLRWPKRARRQALDTIGRDLLDIAAGLQAGLDFDSAVAGLGPKQPWAAYVAQRQAGVSAADAIAQTVRPMWPELATVLTVHGRYGGPLADMLLMMADSLSRERLSAAEMRARSSEARATAAVLAITGPGLGVYMLVREPQLLSPLLTDPLGIIALLGAGTLWLAGLIALRRLLRMLSG